MIDTNLELLPEIINELMCCDIDFMIINIEDDKCLILLNVEVVYWKDLDRKVYRILEDDLLPLAKILGIK